MLFTAAALLAAPVAGCPVEQARYQQRRSGIVAQFRDVQAGAAWPSGLAMKMSFRAGVPDRWWLVWASGSAGGQHLASTTPVTAADWRPPSSDSAAERPLADVSLIAADAEYNIALSPLRRGVAAPAHLLMPDLREALWYRSPPAERAGDSSQFFDLVACDRRAGGNGKRG